MYVRMFFSIWLPWRLYDIGLSNTKHFFVITPGVADYCYCCHDDLIILS